MIRRRHGRRSCKLSLVLPHHLVEAVVVFLLMFTAQIVGSRSADFRFLYYDCTIGNGRCSFGGSRQVCSSKAECKVNSDSNICSNGMSCSSLFGVIGTCCCSERKVYDDVTKTCINLKSVVPQGFYVNEKKREILRCHAQRGFPLGFLVS